jgi:hypothetical protein
MNHLANGNGVQLEDLDQAVHTAVARAWASLIACDLDAFNNALRSIQLRHAHIGLVSMLVALITCAQPVLAQRWSVTDPTTIRLRYKDPADRDSSPGSADATTQFVHAALAYDLDAAFEAFLAVQNRNQVPALLDLCWGWLHSLLHDTPPANAGPSDQLPRSTHQRQPPPHGGLRV